jgi:hypothetical protein
MPESFNMHLRCAAIHPRFNVRCIRLGWFWCEIDGHRGVVGVSPNARYVDWEQSIMQQELKDAPSQDWNSYNSTPLADIQAMRELTESRGYSAEHRIVTPSELSALNKLAGGLEPLACGCSFNERGDMVMTCAEANALRFALRQAKIVNGPEMQAWLNHFKGAQETV